MSKNIELDKFYTPKETAKKCIDIFFKMVDFEDVSEVIEPSAGDGAFSLQIPDCIAFDIEPEHKSIIKQDFLKLELPYKKGRAFIGNPPFGDRNNLALKFFKKSIISCDYIGFVLPISQLNNIDSFFEFDLISSHQLGVLEYSGLKVHCCFNVFKRPKNGLNKKPRLSSKLFSLHRTNRDNFENTKEDFIICKRGSVGKLVEKEGTYADEYKVVVHNKKNLDYVKSTILNQDWKNFKKHQSAPNLSKNDIYRLFN